MPVASSKQARGKGLGKRVTGAVNAKTPEGSLSAEINAVDGRTARPFVIDQSLRLERRWVDCSGLKSGGKSG